VVVVAAVAAAVADVDDDDGLEEPPHATIPMQARKTDSATVTPRTQLVWERTMSRGDVGGMGDMVSFS
jgi:hypothetical protein